MFKRIIKGLKYSFYILSHPISGFYEMRFEGQGDLISSILLLVFLIVAFVFQRQYSGFIFNTTNPKYFSVIRESVSVLATILLWCVANWSITALNDGEGRFKDIFMSVAYASLPMTVTIIIATIMSNMMVNEEQTLMSLVLGLGVFYTGLLVFTGTMTIHQFTVKKNIASIVMTVAGMAFIVFLAIIFAGIFDKLVRYLVGIYVEIRLRM